jgi:ribosomal-protein-alanine N-acetyltransferase
VAPKDLEEVLEIEETAFPNPYPLGYLRFLVKRNPETFLVAENDRGIVGYVISDVRHGNEGHIVSIAVRNDERRRGIARLLIRTVEGRLEKEGADFVCLEVRRSNQPAINLYSSLGYRTTGIASRYYRDGEDAIKMTLTSLARSSSHGSGEAR